MTRWETKERYVENGPNEWVVQEEGAMRRRMLHREVLPILAVCIDEETARQIVRDHNEVVR